ncbi:hypothetical protein H8356DRAFT_974936 [Neocallimastix lanati (nom. inval.)]|jgi:phosphoserine phosphatase|uniref:HAD-like protein n=1 Tax=Neocallimastix californiae TaxID=1754190 RepID=A0A1Y2EPK4_9FUNG|nr:hypothetical protein H8356DRAFT_974936 [Neocallimastix sp. JGI-2020a]ORY72785.1 hypothetical protein LY90DRAFT_666894 [Neocallimastix californiae]|eukprot:ORY72785.1 hypothetical protein LY90DRAFT_666894 [Neocallimastix californiae]
MVFFAFDFDETLTQNDTLDLIIKCTKEVDLNSLIWKRLSQRYCNLVTFSKAEYFKNHKNPSLEDYCEFCRVNEMDSIENIIESKCYDEITKDSLFNIGKTEVKFHNEVPEFLSKLIEEKIPVNIISANFSNDIIKGALSNIKNSEEINIYSNDLEFNENNISNGNIITNYIVASDKLKLFNNLSKDINNNETIYIGDGLTDILCMLNATVGIVFSPGKSFIQDCKEFNILLKPLSTWTEEDLKLEDEDENEERTKLLFFTLNWNDIISWWNNNKKVFL